MYQRINFTDFCDAFKQHDRGDSFSYAGLKVLFDAFAELEKSTGTEMELDVVAICCEWTEYPSMTEALDEYELEFIEELLDSTIVLQTSEDFDKPVVVNNF